MRLLLFLLALLLACVGAAQVAFTTQEFRSDYEVHRDRSFTVTETISVTFSQSRRGIVRTLPQRVRIGPNKTREVDYTLVAAEVNTGRGFEKVNVQERLTDGDWQLRVGDANRTVRGKVTYRLLYRVVGGLNEVSQSGKASTELFWNVVPIEWPTAIENASGSITYPSSSGSLRTRLVVGQRGTRYGTESYSSGQSGGDTNVVSITYPAPNIVDFVVRKPLTNSEGVTVIAALPPNSVDPPSNTPAPERPVTSPPPPPRELPSNPLGFVIPLLPLPFLYLLIRKRFPAHRPLTVRFDPPAGLGASHCGYLVDKGTQARHIVGDIISLAQKGALRLHHGPGGTSDLSIELLGLQKAHDLLDIEGVLYQRLEQYGTHITPDVLRGSFGGDYRLLAAHVESESVTQGWRQSTSVKGCAGCGCAFALVGLTIAGLVLAGPPVLLGALVAGVIGIILVSRITDWTDKGQIVRSDALGLKEFVTRANERELNYMANKMPDQAMFEHILPYAVAFGAVQQWTEAFRGIDLQQPEWFAYDAPFTDVLWTSLLLNSMLDFDHGFSSALSDGISDFGGGGGWGDGGSGFGDGGGFDMGGGGWSDGGGVGDGGGGGGGGDW